MKKLIALSMVAVSLAASSAFGQGYFLFTSSKSQAYDGTGATAVLGSTINVALLWGAASTTPAVDALATQSLKLGNNTTTAASAGYTAAQAWAAITGDGAFQVAINQATGNAVTALTSTTGAIAYNANGSFGITGTSPGSTYTLYEVSFSSAYSTLAAAAAAGAALGWSGPAQYTAVSSIGTPATTAGLFPSFGTFLPVAAPTPEPGTMALAAIGGASLLLFRRKK